MATISTDWPATVASSPSRLPSRARARGETWLTLPLDGSASSSPTMRQDWVRPSSRSIVTVSPKRTLPSGGASTS